MQKEKYMQVMEYVKQYKKIKEPKESSAPFSKKILED